MDARTTVLLVDDSAADVELTLRAIGVQGLPYKFKVIRDGEEALNFLFRRGAYAGRPVVSSLRLIVLDLKMPGVNGLEVLKMVKSDPDLKRVPVVVLTSSGEEADIRASYEMGANGYVQKPVDFDEFRKAVQEIKGYWLDVNRTVELYREPAQV